MPKGGFPSIRHNEIRDLTANLLTEVCSDVCTEPTLQPITGETLNGATSNVQEGARLDIATNGFWGGRFERTYLDVRVFNPHIKSHRQSSLSTCYRKQEGIKKRAYIRTAHPRSWALLLHPPCLLSYRYGKRSHFFLQKTCLMSSNEMGPII